MNLHQRLTTYVAALTFTFAGLAARAEDHPFTEGPVVNVYSIRTEPGNFDDYMDFLSTVWKPTQEASKKAGDVIRYQVIRVEPRGENNPDIYLVTYFRNWAALDGATAKADALAKATEGSLAAANESTTKRGRIRRILGSWTGQQLDLK